MHSTAINVRGLSHFDSSPWKEPPRPKERSSWLRRLAIGVCIFTGIVVFHAPRLRGLGAVLVKETQTHSHTAVLIIGGAGRFDAAADSMKRGALVMLLYQSRPGRLQRMGILPADDE